MEYVQEMNLISGSGYCMPFNGKNEEVVLLRAYGSQRDGTFNHGIDLETNSYVLRAVADGIVIAIGSNKEYGLYQITRYGNYEVTYGNISNTLVTFGKRVKAGNVVAISGNSLHIEVKYDGKEVNPIDFLTMIYGNMAINGDMPNLETVDMDIPTDYDDNKDELEGLMSRYYVDYLNAVSQGLYNVPEHTEQSLRNIFTLAASKDCFYETIPSMANPLGMADRAMPIAAKVQNLLIADFLNYLALRHKIFLSTLSESDKKKDMMKQ